MRTGGDGPGLVRCFAVQGGRDDLNMHDSLGECARKLNLSVQGLESLNFKKYRRVSIAVEALLQRGPGAPEPPDEAVERLVSR